VDGGAIRMSGGTHEVVSAYESAMSRGNPNRSSSDRVAGVKARARFVRWEVVEPRGEQSNVLSALGPVKVMFVVQIEEPVTMGQHGCALFDNDRRLIWAWATEEIKLSAGEYEFRYTFPMLPIRPGPYSWLVSLYDEGDQLDAWDCAPEMIVATEGLQHSADEWNGILNMPSHFEIGGKG
jgi:hypothetical protein